MCPNYKYRIPHVISLQTRVIHAIFVCIWSGFCFRRYLSTAYRGKFALLLFYLFFCILPFTVDAEGGNFVQFVYSLLCFFREGAITLTGMLGPLWRCAALSGSIIASVLMRCWNGMGLRGVSKVSVPQLVCSGLYSAGDSLFPLFFFFRCHDHACCSCFFFLQVRSASLITTDIVG